MGGLHYHLGELETSFAPAPSRWRDMCHLLIQESLWKWARVAVQGQSFFRHPSFWIGVGGLGGLPFIHLKQSLRTSLLGGGSPLLVQETVPEGGGQFSGALPPILSLPVGAVLLRGEETTRVLLTGGG